MIIDAQQTAARLPFDTLISALKTGFAKGCQSPTRHHYTLRRTEEPDGTFLLIPA